MDEIKNENTYGEETNYVAISPDGSTAAKFNPCKLS
jgi:hypothetical protein